MAFDSKGLDSYNDVPSRIAEFRDKHPEGSLQPVDLAEPFKVVEIAGQTFIAYTAAAYRTPDDVRPGIGAAYECFPGRTPYTKGSELQNAETSAWGRAIVAALAADTRKGVASMEEVRNRQAERDQPPMPAGGAETDWAWASAFENKVNASGSQAELTDRWNELVAAFKDGKVTETDGNHLKALIAERKQELTPPRNRDGSTSRSRATDEQLAANGEMTKDQKAEHNALVRSGAPSPDQIERLPTTPPDDPWAAGGPQA